MWFEFEGKMASVLTWTFFKSFKIVLKWGQSLEKIGQIWLQLNYDKWKKNYINGNLLQTDINVMGKRGRGWVEKLTTRQNFKNVLPKFR
jgi:hypothetical protein